MSNIMLVDDDQTMVKLLRTLLELDGHQVLSVTEADEVLSTVKAEQPDLVLMDVNLADADGLEILTELRSNADLFALKIIMSSGLDVEVECMERGADAFILKPYPPDRLSTTIQNLLGE